MRASVALLVALLILPRILPAQSQAWIPIDDPRQALLSHLIARGDVRDPRPFVRPLRQAELDAALDGAVPGGASAQAMVRRLKSQRPSDWTARGAVGGQAYSRARRDLLHPAGPGGARPMAEAQAAVAVGPFTGALRGRWEPRLEDDPDWTDQTSAAPRDAIFRLTDSYIAVGGPAAGVSYGNLSRNWGPPAITGIPLGVDGYAPALLAFEARLGPVSALTMGGPLRAVADPVIPDVARRFTTRRLDIRVGNSATVGLWESGVSSTQRTGALATLADPWRPLLLERLVGGEADDRNILLGTDIAVRAGGALLIEAQAALDDVGSEGGPDDAKRPPRWGGGLGLAGPLGPSLSWRGRVSAGTSLLYRTPRPEEYYSDGAIGLGRNSADQVAATLSLGIPVRAAWLVTPEFTWQRQGEGNLLAPFPEGEALGATPAFFIGTPSTLWQAGAGIAGQEGMVALLGFAGVQHTRNADHVPGRTRTRLEGRIQATIGFSMGGTWR